MIVWVCRHCGLTQSTQQHPEAQKIRTLSADADWGNVRHGKGVRFDFLRQKILQFTTPSDIRHALDIGANRGDFALWLNQENPDSAILAIEPDTTVTASYNGIANILVKHARIEHEQLPAEQFDLIFCSHTLEHAHSGRHMLGQIHDALSPIGIAVIEVPNLEVLDTPDIVEEFFIDKHTFHFDRQTLLNMVKSIGFDVLSGTTDTDKMNITLVLKRGTAISPSLVADEESAHVRRNCTWLNAYPGKLTKNRGFLKAIVETKLHPLAKRQKVAYWGASRIFDALVKYGKLDPQSVFCLVDRYLHATIGETHGIKIHRPEYLRLVEPHVIVVLGNSAEEAIARTAYEMGIRHVLKFSELMGQVRDLPGQPD